MKVIKPNETIELKDGNWVMLPDSYMYQRCCRCGLTHFWEFNHTSSGVMIVASSLDDTEAKRIEERFKRERLIK